ncbi:TraR/DksA family transcriptional regulator [Streptomyces polyrhachis]|uniref:TraR/DksA family transcriptional regulator n=1 Tax=Streptomyces polyrhachis TaxID=1282885 RepID=A0ABW2GAD0_9ACTN
MITICEGVAAMVAEKSTSAARKAAAKKPVAKQTAAKKSAAKKTAVKKSTTKTAAKKTTGASRMVAKKSPAAAKQGTGAGGARLADAPEGLAVRPGEDPWTDAEVAEARRELAEEADRLQAEIAAADASIARMMWDGGAGAGDDDADTGTKNMEREHGMALAAGARERLGQTERALERMDAGTYGLCESCGKAIGKARMQAFPRATLCVECKQRQERR